MRKHCGRNGLRLLAWIPGGVGLCILLCCLPWWALLALVGLALLGVSVWLLTCRN